MDDGDEIMNRRLLLPLFFSLMLLLVACSESAPVVVDPDAPLDLPVSINVQTVAEIKDRDDVVVLDVREQHEYDAGHIPGVVLLPMSELQGRVDEIPTDQTVVLTCRSGNRSNQVTKFLQDAGFDNVHNMQGGIVAWQKAGLAVEQ